MIWIEIYRFSSFTNLNVATLKNIWHMLQFPQIVGVQKSRQKKLWTHHLVKYGWIGGGSKTLTTTAKETPAATCSFRDFGRYFPFTSITGMIFDPQVLVVESHFFKKFSRIQNCRYFLWGVGSSTHHFSMSPMQTQVTKMLRDDWGKLWNFNLTYLRCKLAC